MKENKKLFLPSLYIVLIVSMIFLLAGAMGYKNAGPAVEGVHYIQSMSASINGAPEQQVTLPHSFKKLSGRTPVTLTATIYPKSDDAIYIKSVYSPAKIYLNDHLVYEFGKRENYPSFMKDPATEVHIIESHGNAQSVQLRMEFKSPYFRRNMTIHPPIVGTSKEIILERFHHLGVPFVLSLAQIIFGISVMLISFCIMLMDTKGIIFFWMGLFSFTAGMWAFGENNFSGLIFKNSTMLYLISFIGLFTFIIPLLHLVDETVGFENKKPLKAIELFVVIMAVSATLLQLFGIVPFAQSMYLFHIVLPLVIIFLFGFTIYESIHYKNTYAKRFIPSIGILVFAAVGEFLNYQLPITYAYYFSFPFQAGIIFFLLSTGIVAGMSVKDTIYLKNKQKKLEFEQNILAMQTEEQKKNSLLLAKTQQLLSQQRHDLRHQLTAIQDMADPDNEKLQNYLSSLIDKIPKAKSRFCQNDVVNAVISHYHYLCQEKGINFTVKLSVPAITEQISDSSLCVIFGNLLENAVEACDRMTDGKQFIILHSSVQYDLLTITMDNSFDGNIVKEGERFRSSKREDFGIGLASVKSVAQKFGGDAQFKAENHVFLSSVYVKLS